MARFCLFLRSVTGKKQAPVRAVKEHAEHVGTVTKQCAGTMSPRSADFESTASADSNVPKSQHLLAEKNSCCNCIYYSIYFLIDRSLGVGQEVMSF